jgi:CHAD domain-containing protein
MARETETKYEADAGTDLPRLDGLPGVRRTRGPELQQLDAEYYDTADLRLLTSGITLRQRSGGHDAGWHLKLPAGAGSRDELQLPPGRTGQVPAEFTDLVRARVRGQALVPVAQITTLRQVTTLLGAADRSLAEVADDQVHATARIGGAEPARWREIEVELTGGDDSLLVAADKLLRRAGLHRSDRSAKLERALGNRAPARPGRPAAGRSAADVVTAYLREHAGRLMALDPMVRRGAEDSVHQMRVATRRLRSTLRTFGSVVAAADSEYLAGELQWLGSVLGEQRDAEVQAGRLQDHLRRTDVEMLLGPVQARIQAHAAKTAATSHAAVTAALNSEQYYAMLDALDTLIAGPKTGPQAGRPASKVLPAAVGRSFRKARRRMRAACKEPAGPARDTRLHAARKSAKRARYAAEAAVPVAGSDARRFAGQMKKVQSVLGDHQDTVVGRQVTRRLGISAQLAGESAFAYGLFHGYDTCAGRYYEAKARKTWQRARMRRYRSWLD